jgi:hypothetical protein
MPAARSGLGCEAASILRTAVAVLARAPRVLLVVSILLAVVLWEQETAAAVAGGEAAAGTVAAAAAAGTPGRDPAGAAMQMVEGEQPSGPAGRYEAVRERVERLLDGLAGGAGSGPGGEPRVALVRSGATDQGAPGERGPGTPSPITPELSRLWRPRSAQVEAAERLAEAGGEGQGDADFARSGSLPAVAGGETAAPAATAPVPTLKVPPWAPTSLPPIPVWLVVAAAAAAASAEEQPEPPSVPAGPTPDRILDILKFPVRAYPPGPAGNDRIDWDPVHDRSERVVRQWLLTPVFGLEFAPEPPEPLLPRNAVGYTIFNGSTSFLADAIRVDRRYAAQNRLWGAVRDLSGMTLLSRPTWESPLLNTLWNAGVNSAIVYGAEVGGRRMSALVAPERLEPFLTHLSAPLGVRDRWPLRLLDRLPLDRLPFGLGDRLPFRLLVRQPRTESVVARELSALRGLEFHTGIMWPIIAMGVGMQVLGGLVKPLLQSPTLDLWEFTEVDTGEGGNPALVLPSPERDPGFDLFVPTGGKVKVANPLYVLPAPIGQDADGHRKVWARNLHYWLDKAFDGATILVPVLAGQLFATDPRTAVVIATISTASKVGADVLDDLPPEGDPLGDPLRAATGLRDPDPESLGELLWVFGANLGWVLGRGGVSLLLNHHANLPLWAKRAEATVKEAAWSLWSFDPETQRGPRDPVFDLISQETWDELTPSWNRAWAAWNQAMRLDTKSPAATAVQTPLLVSQLGIQSVLWLRQQYADKVVDLTPDDPPPAEQLPQLGEALGDAWKRIWRNLGEPTPPGDGATLQPSPTQPVRTAADKLSATSGEAVATVEDGGERVGEAALLDPTTGGQDDPAGGGRRDRTDDPTPATGTPAGEPHDEPAADGKRSVDVVGVETNINGQRVLWRPNGAIVPLPDDPEALDHTGAAAGGNGALPVMAEQARTGQLPTTPEEPGTAEQPRTAPPPSPRPVTPSRLAGQVHEAKLLSQPPLPTDRPAEEQGPARPTEDHAADRPEEDRSAGQDLPEPAKQHHEPVAEQSPTGRTTTELQPSAGVAPPPPSGADPTPGTGGTTGAGAGRSSSKAPNGDAVVSDDSDHAPPGEQVEAAGGTLAAGSLA